MPRLSSVISSPLYVHDPNTEICTLGCIPLAAYLYLLDTTHGRT